MNEDLDRITAAYEKAGWQVERREGAILFSRPAPYRDPLDVTLREVFDLMPNIHHHHTIHIPECTGQPACTITIARGEGAKWLLELLRFGERVANGAREPWLVKLARLMRGPR